MKIICNECEDIFNIEDPLVGEKLTCPECGISLKIISIKGSDVDTEMLEEEIEDWGE